MHSDGCNYLSMLGLKLNHVSKRGHRLSRSHLLVRWVYYITHNVFVSCVIWTGLSGLSKSQCVYKTDPISSRLQLYWLCDSHLLVQYFYSPIFDIAQILGGSFAFEMFFDLLLSMFIFTDIFHGSHWTQFPWFDQQLCLSDTNGFWFKLYLELRCLASSAGPWHPRFLTWWLHDKDMLSALLTHRALNITHNSHMYADLGWFFFTAHQTVYRMKYQGFPIRASIH